MPKKLTTEEFIKRAKEIHGDKYDYSLIDYKNSQTKVKIICPIHGIFEQKPANHLDNCGCQKCNKHDSLTVEEFIEKANKVHNNKYDYSLVNYINNKTKIKIICPIHGVFEQFPTHHLQKAGCKKCSKVYKPSTEEFIDMANRIHYNKYDYSKTFYKSAHSKIKIICLKHGEFEQTPSDHLKGNGCPLCRESKGEEKIATFFKNNKISYERNKKFDNLKDKKRLSYDFYLQKYNLLIEFNGRQHYETSAFSHHNLKLQKHHDWLKRKYAKNNGFNLLIIPYWDFDNINTILNNQFEKILIKDN